IRSRKVLLKAGVSGRKGIGRGERGNRRLEARNLEVGAIQQGLTEVLILRAIDVTLSGQHPAVGTAGQRAALGADSVRVRGSADLLGGNDARDYRIGPDPASEPRQVRAIHPALIVRVTRGE